MHFKYSAKLSLLVDKMVKHQAIDFDNVVLITGNEGLGKSTLGMEISYLLQKRNGFKFDFEKNIEYGQSYDSLFKKLLTLEHKQTLLVDEAVQFAYLRNALFTQQKRLNMLLQEIRSRNLNLILIIPNLLNVDKYLLRNRVQIIIMILSRKKFVVFIKSKNPLAENPWNVDRMNEILENTKYLTVKEIIEALKQHPNFLFWSNFYNIDNKSYMIYKSLKEKHLYGENELFNANKEKTNEDILQEKLKTAVMLLQENSNLPLGKIANKLGLSKYKLKKLLTGINETENDNKNNSINEENESEDEMNGGLNEMS